MAEQMTPAQQADLQAITELAVLEQSGDYQPLVINLGPFAAYTLVSSLQLVCRHDEVNGQLRSRIEGMARQVQGQFGPDVQRILEAGWDPGMDQPC